MRLLLAVALVATLAGCRHTSDAGPDPDEATEMRHQHDGDTPVASGAADGADALDVIETRVRYATVAGQVVEGVLVKPAGVAEPLPGVIVIHEWWGLNDNVVAMARKVAAEGYTALAVDLYDGASAETPDQAMNLMQSAMGHPANLLDNLRQAYGYLSDAQGASRVASLGWCFGGGWSLRTALALPTELSGAVVYYGQPVTDPAMLRTLQMPVLALFGGADTSIPADTVAAFERALDAAGVQNTVVTYPGAAHAFANPSGGRYDAEAATDAWARTTAFLADVLR